MYLVLSQDDTLEDYTIAVCKDLIDAIDVMGYYVFTAKSAGNVIHASDRDEGGFLIGFHHKFIEWIRIVEVSNEMMGG